MLYNVVHSRIGLQFKWGVIHHLLTSSALIPVVLRWVKEYIHQKFLKVVVHVIIIDHGNQTERLCKI